MKSVFFLFRALLAFSMTAVAAARAPASPQPRASADQSATVAHDDKAIAESAPAAVPGIVINHSPASSRHYVGSPGIAILPDGTYVAKHDEFGFGIENTRAVTRVFGSADHGQTWQALSVVDGSFWSSIFVHQDALWLLGTDRQYGRIVIFRSADGGRTWTRPSDARTGILRADGHFHCAPTPVISHGGRLWRAFEDADGPGGWGGRFRAFMMSVPAEADLLDAANWISSNPLGRDAGWNGGDFNGWLEGNAVAAPDGRMVDILRVDTRSPDEKAAVVRIAADGRTAGFDPLQDLVAFPGGAKKFTIRFDPQAKVYWTLANLVPEQHRHETPGAIRNTLALVSSADLRTWTPRCVILYHPDATKHAFQYVDWLFDGNDIIYVSRTAYDDDAGGAPNYHDADYLTFHRLKGFRQLTMADSVPMR